MRSLENEKLSCGHLGDSIPNNLDPEKVNIGILMKIQVKNRTISAREDITVPLLY